MAGWAAALGFSEGGDFKGRAGSSGWLKGWLSWALRKVGTKRQGWTKGLAEGAATLGSSEGWDLRAGLGQGVAAMSSSEGWDFK